MATANQVVSRALRLAGVIASGETANADLAADTLDVYNALLSEWHAAGLGIPDYTIANLSTTTSTDAGDNEAIAHQIAYRVMAEYGLSASPEFMANKVESFNRLRLRYFQPGVVDLTELPSSRWWSFNITTD